MNGDQKTIPIFVIGRHRSGTTWVSNMIAAHPDVFTPEHREHKGQHESAFFSALAPYCRWGKTEQDRIALQAIFERSDFFYLSFKGIGSTLPPPLINAKDFSVFEYFRNIMDSAAKQRKCKYWLEKTPRHTLLLKDLMKWFPDARFIAVKRKRGDVIRSNVYKFGRPSSILDWLRNAIWTVVYEKVISVYNKHIYTMQYEDLLLKPNKEKSRLFAYLGLDTNQELENKWEADSAYNGLAPPIPLCNRIIMEVAACGFALLPARFVSALARFRVKHKKGILPKWFFRVYRGDRSLNRE